MSPALSTKLAIEENQKHHSGHAVLLSSGVFAFTRPANTALHTRAPRTGLPSRHRVSHSRHQLRQLQKIRHTEGRQPSTNHHDRIGDAHTRPGRRHGAQSTAVIVKVDTV